MPNETPPTSAPTGARPAVAANIRHWRNAVFVVFALCGFAIASLASRVPAVSLALHLSTAQVGSLLFGIALGSIVGLIASGHLIANFGARTVLTWVLILSPIALTVAAIGIATLHSFAVAFVGLIFFGAASGTCDVGMNVSGAANERALGKSIMPIYHAFFSVGTIAAAGIGALAEALHVPLEIHIGVLSILALIAGVISVRYLLPEVDPSVDHSKDEGHPADTWRTRLNMWRDPRTIMIGLVVLGMAFTEGSANDWTSYATVHGHGADAATGALVLGVFVTAMTIGRLSGVRLLDRFGRVPVLRGTAIAAAVGLLLFIFVPVFWIDIVGVVLWGLGASLGFPVGMSAAADDPRTAAARVSAVATIGYVAFLVGPPAIGFLGDRFGILNGLLLVLVLAAIAGVFSFAAREPARAAASL
jgi:MFS family permease